MHDRNWDWRCWKNLAIFFWSRFGNQRKKFDSCKFASCNLRPDSIQVTVFNVTKLHEHEVSYTDFMALVHIRWQCHVWNHGNYLVSDKLHSLRQVMLYRLPFVHIISQFQVICWNRVITWHLTFAIINPIEFKPNFYFYRTKSGQSTGSFEFHIDESIETTHSSQDVFYLLN